MTGGSQPRSPFTTDGNAEPAEDHTVTDPGRPLSPRRSPDGQTPFAPGQIIDDRYRIERRLGRGGMGEVWHAVDLKLQVEVALKSLLGTHRGSARARELPRREVRAARQVISPNVCRIFDLVIVDGQELVSMEYIDGQTLTESLCADGALELHDAADVASQFLAGLEAIHHAGLVHRDIKPDNVMLTRAGRVVLMDFGIAKPPERAGTVAGTAPYMAPEQLRGEVDARSDVFASGVMLAELIGGAEIRDHPSRERLWSGIRETPPRLPDSPWRDVLRQAVDADPERRFRSARALARALEEVTLKAEGADDRTPYPGLAAFTAADAEYFFGRESEVEAVVRKLGRLHLQAIIGPSGTGKSSFLRAGLIPALGADWGCVICHPGSSPFLSLGQALAPELAGDTEAVRDLMSFEDPEIALAVLARWRQKHTTALVIVDQFEELFTQSDEEAQSRFAGLLQRAALEADVRVLLAMRDDFLYQCQAQPALAPIFADLTPIGTLTGATLRRALVQPALLCGYRFEDEALVAGMVGEVTEERGALPLLAFAAACLWERRDRERGLLTSAAYEDIGGVGGALAQHAEATLKRIGSERLPLVRELFRNLVTAEGTRATRSVGELLSLFGEQTEAGREVLQSLTEARLLTAFDVAEVEGAKEGDHQRVEIIHESLLSAWPRLVRWRTQDADGAQLREQLRQAAQLWEARKQPTDLLWSGASFHEFEVWRRHYPGTLTAAEEDYARAMTAHAQRRARRRRMAVAAAFVALLTVLGVVGFSRQQAVTSHRQAIAEANRAEVGKLLALGRLELSPDSREYCPSTALAYAIAAIERIDSSETRRFALEALWRGPTGFALTSTGTYIKPFSADGKWLIQAAPDGIKAWPRSGEVASAIPVDLAHFPGAWYLYATENPDVVEVGVARSRPVEFWSIKDRRLLRAFAKDSACGFVAPTGIGTLICLEQRGGLTVVRELPLRGGEARVLGSLESALYGGAAVRGRSLVTFSGRTLRLHDIDRLDLSARIIGEHDSPIANAYLYGPTNTLLSADQESATIRVWSLTRAGGELAGTYQGPPGLADMSVDQQNRTLGAASRTEGTLWLRDLRGPPDAEPLVLHRKGSKQVTRTSVEPQGQWVATSGLPAGLMLWPLRRKHPFVLSRELGKVWDLAFHPDGRSVIVASANGSVSVWPLGPTAGESSRILFRAARGFVSSLDVDPQGRWVLAGTVTGPWLIPLDGSPPRSLPGFNGWVWAVALSPDGRYAAAGGGHDDASERVIRIWDLQTGKEVRVLGPPDVSKPGGAQIIRLLYTPDGRRLISASWTGVLVWDLEDGSHEYLGDGLVPALAHDGNTLFAAWSDWGEFGAAGVYDLKAGTLRELSTHGKVGSIALSPDETIVVTGGIDGPIRVGPADGGEPHLLLGHKGYTLVKVSPDGRWIASGSTDGSLRVWPMPDLTRPPLHTLPGGELVARLKSLSNFRAVKDDSAPDGYRIEAEPFAGWGTVPEW